LISALSALRLILLLTLGLVVSLSAVAHESRPLYIEVTELKPQQYLIGWQIPSSVSMDNQPVVSLSPPCTRAEKLSGENKQLQQLYFCEAGIEDVKVLFRYPKHNPSLTTLLQITQLNGDSIFSALAPNVSETSFPTMTNIPKLLWEYFSLGVHHILTGYDHLLFLACLLFIAKSLKRIFLMVSGFTLAHSLTLTLTTFQLFSPPSVLIEAVVALSILVLARELATGQKSLISSYPFGVSCGFGLLHGFAFAGALQGLGLAQSQILISLVSFNLGVEAGQLIFVTAILASLWLIQRMMKTPETATLLHWWTARSTSYLAGILASVWLIERTLQF
jgi:hypothetical protein